MPVARFIRNDGKIATKNLAELAPRVDLNPRDFGEPQDGPIYPTDLTSFALTEEMHGEQAVYREIDVGARWVSPGYSGGR